MKSHKSKKLFTLVAVLFLLGLSCPSTGWSDYTLLHKFTGPPNDGGQPGRWQSSLAQDSLYLYGMTGYGGAGVGTSPCNELGCGVIFRQKKDGSDYTILHYFRDGSVVGDGYWPFGNGLTLSGSTIYGMTPSGGNTGGGVLFKINTDGTDYTILHHFSMGGSVPVGSPTLSGSTLYGMTHEGATADGGEGAGVIFRVDTDGSDYAVLHRFPDKTVGEDGVFPRGPLTLSGSTLYGATFDSYPEGGGVLFKINTDGSGYTILHHFNDPFSGFYPSDDLTISGSTLYGTVLSVQKGSRTGSDSRSPRRWLSGLGSRPKFS